MHPLLEVVIHQCFQNLPWQDQPYPYPWHTPSLSSSLRSGFSSIHFRYCPHKFLLGWDPSFAGWPLGKLWDLWTTPLTCILFISVALLHRCVWICFLTLVLVVQLEFEGFPSFSTSVILGIFFIVLVVLYDFQSERRIKSQICCYLGDKNRKSFIYLFSVYFNVLFVCLRWSTNS